MHKYNQIIFDNKIERLEDQLDKQLFVRSSRKPGITAEGKRICNDCDSKIDMTEEIKTGKVT